jgi:hypothetical protein
MRSTLKAIGLVVLGFLLCTYFQYTLNFQYTHVYETTVSKNARQVTLALQPYHEAPVINLFEHKPDSE